MLAGGAEELCPTEAMAFDMLYATSRRNDAPHTTPRPYDRDRDGLVVGEGAGDAGARRAGARAARAARAFTRSWSASPPTPTACTSPSPKRTTMRIVMELALRDAGLAPERDRLRERPRHGDRARRHRRDARHRVAVRRAHAAQLAEELSRPHARRLRRARSVVQHRDDERRLVRADAQSGEHRSALRRARLHRRRRPRARHRAT